MSDRAQDAAVVWPRALAACAPPRHRVLFGEAEPEPAPCSLHSLSLSFTHLPPSPCSSPPHSSSCSTRHCWPQQSRSWPPRHLLAVVRSPSPIRLTWLPLHCPHSLLPSRWPKETSKSKMILLSCYLFNSGATLVISFPAVASVLLWRSVLITTERPQPSPADPSPLLPALAGRARLSQAVICHIQ